jgi:SAM-dependent methyltransferase
MTNSPLIFDRKLIADRARRALARGPATFLAERAAGDLVDRLAVVLRKFPVAVDLGTPTNILRKLLAGNPAVGSLVAANVLAGNTSGSGLQVAADEEILPFRNASLDLVVSALALQAVNDLPGTLIQIRRALKPDGLLLAALLGGDTLTELRESFFQAEEEVEGGASPRVAPFLDGRAAGALLQRAGFALPVVDVDNITVRYSSPLALMRDLRAMGATNPMVERRRKPLRRATLLRMVEIYVEKFGDADGKVRATFDIVWLSGWAPHESQQKPLAPGSARTKLADALGTTEIPTGEKAGG